MISTTLTAMLSSLKSSTPVICPVCGGTGGTTCIDCNGSGANNSSFNSSSSDSDSNGALSRSVSYNFNDGDNDMSNTNSKRKGRGAGESRTALGIVGRNPRECGRCLGVGVRLCKACEGTGYVKRM